MEQEPDGYVCVFVLPDDTPRLFRVAARDFWEDRFWQSQAIALAPDGQEDSGGNRGGSVTPVSPQRTPTLPSPTPTPAPTSTPTPTGSPSLAATPAPAAGRAAPKPAALSPAEETPQPTPAAPAGTATPETPAATAAPLPTATPETAAPSHRALPLPGQILLVAAGLTGTGFADTGTYPLPDGVTKGQVVRAVTGTVAAGTVQDFDITWGWNYYDSDERDKQDTVLGDTAAFSQADEVTAGFYIVVEDDSSGSGSYLVPGIPQTGDDTPLTLYGVLVLISGILLVLLWRERRKDPQ